MKGNEYQKLAMRTNDGKATERLLKAIEKASRLYDVDMGEALNASAGLGGEVGEVHDMIKKWVWQEMPFDKDKLALELGDVMWYIAQMCNAFGWNLEQIMEMNIEKLRRRYPDGFDPVCSIARKDLMADVVAETKDFVFGEINDYDDLPPEIQKSVDVFLEKKGLVRGPAFGRCDEDWSEGE